MTKKIIQFLRDLEQRIRDLQSITLGTLIYDKTEVDNFDIAKRIVAELQQVLHQLEVDFTHPVEKKITINLEDTPYLQHLYVVLGKDNVRKFIKEIIEEIKEERAFRRSQKAKQIDNQLTRDLIDDLKDAGGNQSLELTPPHGTRIKWKNNKNNGGRGCPPKKE